MSFDYLIDTRPQRRRSRREMRHLLQGRFDRLPTARHTFPKKIREKKMNNILAVLGGTLMSAVWLIPTALAQTTCVTQNMAVPPGANTSDKAAPFFIDTTGLDFSTKPPTRDPSN